MNAVVPITLNEIYLACPVLRHFYKSLSPEVTPKSKHIPVAEALAEIVVSQMLTQKDAESLICELKKRAHGDRIWRMPEQDLFDAGLSRSKARTISLMARHYLDDSRQYEDWRTTPPDSIRKQLNMLWGMGEWTLDMLLLRYFGHQDVWPKNDARINRVIEKLKRYCAHHGISWKLDPDKAAPFRSTLALMLWSLEDDDQLYH
jgi:3-methyladenine DNA glycosylase/8-oxoguanine DNA glycosylase